MILFPENGRLGNQLFQLCGLQTLLPNQRLILIGFEDLRSVFTNINAIFISKSHFLSPYLYKIFCKLRFFSRFRVFSSISEELYSENYKLIIRKGLFANIYVPENLFFQHFDVFSNITHFPLLRSNLIDCAYLWLSSNC